jgi:hypothetical protein
MTTCGHLWAATRAAPRPAQGVLASFRTAFHHWVERRELEPLAPLLAKGRQGLSLGLRGVRECLQTPEGQR